MIRTVFFGTPQFAVPSLEALIHAPNVQVVAVITQPDRPSGRGGPLTAPPVKQIALREGIPVFQPHSLRKEFSTLRLELETLGPCDLGVVIAFGQILPQDVLDWPSYGCVNIHASLLPRWRGAAPIQRAIEAGDSETGVCLMRMDAGLDTGPVYSTARTAISDSDTTGSLHDRLSLIGAELLIHDINSIVTGSLTASPQSEVGVSYAKKITAEECKITWSDSATALARRIRAFTPTPGCFAVFQGRRLKILRAQEVGTRDLARDVPVGTVIRSGPEALLVPCGEGLLSVEEIQLEGKKKMTITEFLRGNSVPVGTSLN